MRVKKLKLSGAGFTIVELMIALSVLSTILIVAAVTMIGIGSLYSKGVNAANLQNTNRNVMNDVSTALQFSGNDPDPCTATLTTCYANSSGPSYAFCIGNVRYTYILNQELGLDSTTGINTPHILWRDTRSNAAGCTPLDMTQPNPTATAGSTGGIPNSTDGYEVALPHTRLTKFKIIESGSGTGVYNVDVWMAYGDNDLVVVNPDGSATCHGGAGTQYCGISKLSASVIRRKD